LALALCKELQNDYKLPAYILRTKDFPGRSLMRGTPPTVPSQVMQPNIRMPEKIRTFDEAAVLVGNEKTMAAQKKLWEAVKKINPKCLAGVSTPFPWRKGLSQALRTTNPYVPAQLLYPHTTDRLVVKINSGLRSLVNCPGRYSLQVAEFSGRSAFQLDPQQQIGQIMPDLKTSPLQTAHDDAEKLTDKLARAPQIQHLGLPVYVFHDRTSSRVFIGSFNDLQDPAVYRAREAALLLASTVVEKNSQKKQAALDYRIVPAYALTDLSVYKTQLHN
jgi:hypothetical protein